ncbi:D-aminoacylase [bacterium BMS3Abin15]|nr:D-aminoacylase [bacterium BMS3Abin15]
MYDIIIKNGTIIDGTGKPMFSGDVGIKEGEIKEIGDLHSEQADKIIDATGQYVTPGFVDINNHSDTYWRIFLDPDLPSLIYQGITTIVGGNCGSSLAPLVSHDNIHSIQKWADIKQVNLNWLRMEEFLNEVERKKLSVNFATLVGHSTLRRGLIRDEVRGLNSHEMKTMKKMLTQAMKEGAIGLSTGLVYTHAKLAPEKEIAEIAKVVKKYDGVYTTHIRGESHDLIPAVEEAIKTAQASGVKLQISHLKVMGEKNWYLMDEAINLIETAKASGVDVTFDVYPYAVTGSVLYILLPDWVAKGGKKMMIDRLEDPSTRKRVVDEMKNAGIDYSKITIAISHLNKTLTRKKIIDIATSQGKPAEEVIVDLLVASEGRVITSMAVLSEKNMIKAIRHPFSIISSNGSGYSIDHKKSGELVHPRNFGSFPKVLAEYVRDKKILSWEEAIHKMSGKPAEKFGIKKRGMLKKNNFADVLVINPNEIRDLATEENPYQYSQGIKWAVINGEIVLENGKYNKKKAGEVIRK